MSDIDVAREALSQISPTALEYDEWLAVGMALKDAGASFDEWERVEPARRDPLPRQGDAVKMGQLPQERHVHCWYRHNRQALPRPRRQGYDQRTRRRA